MLVRRFFHNNDDLTTMRKVFRRQVDQDEHERLSLASAVSFIGHTSRTSQSEKDNCDLNILVRRFGVGPLQSPIDPSGFGSYDSSVDLRVALEVVADARSRFMELPPNVRREFGNDPLELLAALEDETQHEKLRELGLLKAKEVERPAVRADPPTESESLEAGTASG